MGWDDNLEETENEVEGQVRGHLGQGADEEAQEGYEAEGLGHEARSTFDDAFEDDGSSYDEASEEEEERFDLD
ncbi:MAG TPA: hypothetical protein VIJ15_14135 [Dermatophilaceae bacterium]